MGGWNIVQKSVKLFINLTVGNFLSRPLDDEQIVITPGSIRFKEIYLDIDKLNTALCDFGLPVILRVAYLSELILSPSNLEINGLDLVIQLVPAKCPLSPTDEVLSSMLSSVTAAAAAAAKVADDGDSSSINMTEEPSSLGSRAQKFFQNLLNLGEDQISSQAASSVDQNSKEWLAQLIDFFIVQTCVVLTDLSIRIECQLGLPELDRASGLTLCVDQLLLTDNHHRDGSSRKGSSLQRRCYKKKKAKPNPESSDSAWSWIKWFGGWSLQDSPSDPDSDDGVLPRLLRKLVRVKRVNVFWDLWRTTPTEPTTSTTPSHHHSDDSGSNGGASPTSSDNSRSCSTCSTTSRPATVVNKYAFPGPSSTNLITSSRLISLDTSSQSTELHFSLPSCWLAASHSLLLATSSQQQESTSDTESILRVSASLGPLLVCLSPSHLYWVNLLLGHVTRLIDSYLVERRRLLAPPTQSCLGDACRSHDPPSTLLPSEYQHERTLTRQGGAFPDTFAMKSDWRDGSPSNAFSHSVNRPSDSEFVELDLTSTPDDDDDRHSPAFITDPSGGDTTSMMMKSDLFTSCVTHLSDNQQSDPEQSPDVSDQFSIVLSGKLACLVVVLLLEDEPPLVSSNHKDTARKGRSESRSPISSLSSDRSSSSDPWLYSTADNEVPYRPRVRSSSMTGNCVSGVKNSRRRRYRSANNKYGGESPQDAFTGPSLFFTRYYASQMITSHDRLLPPGAKLESDIGSDGDQWIIGLSRHFASLVKPRDHLCFIAGLGQFDTCSLTSGRRRRCHGNALPGDDGDDYHVDFNCQLRACLLTEGLFIPSSTSSSDGDASLAFEPVDIISFCTVDSGVPRAANKPIIAINGSIDRFSTPTARLTLSPCLTLNIDPSLSDRLYRLVDALRSASDALLLFGPDLTDESGLSRNRRPNWTSSRLLSDESSGDHHHQTRTVPTTKSTSSIWTVNLTCPRVNVNLRIPIPLEAVPLPNESGARTLTELRSHLWTTCVPLTVPSSIKPSIVGGRLAWWRRSLREEYLALSLNQLSIELTTSSLSSNRSSHQHRLESSCAKVKVNLMQANAVPVQSSPLIQLRSDKASLIKLSALSAPQGERHELVEDREVNSPSGGKSRDQRCESKHHASIPFIILSDFQQESTDRHAKTTTYYVGDSQHLRVYRKLARSCCHSTVKLVVPSLIITVDHGQVIRLTYLRLLHDLLLYRSLLPSDCRSRAALSIRRQTTTSGSPKPLHEDNDHRCWIFAQPAPLAAIYAHPEASRAAAELEARYHDDDVDQNFVEGAAEAGLHYTAASDNDDDEGSGESSGGEPFLMNRRRRRFRNHRKRRRSGSQSRSKVLATSTYRLGMINAAYNTKSAVQSDADWKEPMLPNNGVDQTSSSVGQGRRPLCCFKASFDRVAVRLTNGGGGLLELEASDMSLFAQLGHRTNAQLNYLSCELSSFKLSLHELEVGQVGQKQSSAWPLLLPFSLRLDGRCVHFRQDHYEKRWSVVGGPMLALALQHQRVSAPHHHSASGTLDELNGQVDELILSVRLQDTCLVLWPPSTDSPPLTQQPCDWIHLLRHLLTLPSANELAACLPGFQPRDLSLDQYIHLDRSTVSWTSLPPLFDQQQVDSSSKVVRALLCCESLTLTVNQQTDVTVSKQPAGDEQLSVGSQLLLTGVQVDNACLFLCPIEPAIQMGIDALTLLDRPPSPPRLLSPSAFVNWVKGFDLGECVCVFDLDHVEVKCQVKTPLDDGDGGQPRDDDDSDKNGLVDIRLTNNRLRFNTCADSLASLRSVVEALVLCSSSSLLALTLPSTSQHPCRRREPSGGDLTKVADTASVEQPADLLSELEESDQQVDAEVESLLRGAIHNEQLTSSPIESTSTPPADADQYNQSLSHDLSPHSVLSRDGDDGDDQLSRQTSFSDDFVIVQHSMVPPASPIYPLKDQVRRLVGGDSSEDALPRLHTNFYPLIPSRHKFGCCCNPYCTGFTDPPTRYPPASFALTVHDVSLEWNVYDGCDLSAPPPTSQHHQLKRRSIHTSSSGSLDHPPPPSQPKSNSPRESPSSSSRQHHQHRPVPVARPITVSSSPMLLEDQLSHRDRACFTTVQDFYTRGGPWRDRQKCISIRLDKLYFRRSSFSNDNDRGTWATGAGSNLSVPREVGLTNVTRTTPNSLNKMTSYSSCPSIAANNTSWPNSRVALSVGSLLILDRVAESKVNQLVYTYNSPDPKATFNSDLPSCYLIIVGWPMTDGGSGQELDVKLSIQPLRINLDQKTLNFLGEFQLAFARQTMTGAPALDNNTDESSSMTGGLGGGGGSVERPVRSSPSLSQPPLSCQDQGAQSSLFIRKLTFYPDLYIRLDGQFDLGSLTKADLILSRRVYQRGYHSVDRLVGEVLNDLNKSIESQLPRMCATSLGPMHEIRTLASGLWDLVSQPVISFYDSANLSDVTSHHLRSASRLLGLKGQVNKWSESPSYSSLQLGEGVSGLVHGIQRGTRSFSNSTLWAALQLSIQGIRTLQSVAETTYDLVTPGPSLRSRRPVRLRQPSDLREGLSNALDAFSTGIRLVSEDLTGATRVPEELDIGYKGPVGMVGDVLRQIPPTLVTPIVTGCEATANLLGGLRNQIRPSAKLEDEHKWKDTHGL